MASLEQIAASDQRHQAALARRAATEAGKLWAQIDPTDIARSWTAQLARAVALLSGTQQIAAGGADDYVSAALAAQGTSTEKVGSVQPSALSGVASDGRDLASLLYQPVISALTAIGGGAAASRALTLGQVHLDMIVRTQVADAGRVATSVAIASRPHATGYIRMVSAGACSRCIILAGRHYAWSKGFLRHPRCHCRNIPSSENVPDDLRTDPRAAFDALSPAQQDKTFTKAGAQSIRDGADMGKVVNSRRGMFEAGGRKFTHEAAGRRPRLMPEQIMREAKGDRAEAVRLLEHHGYLRPSLPRVTVPKPAALTFDQRMAAAATEHDALASATFGLDRRPRPDAFTQEMARAVNTYTGSEYAAINNYLRGKALPYGYTVDEVTPVIARLDEALAASRLGRDVTTYRGVLDASGMFGDRLAGDLTGMQWREDAYLSTSAKQRKAQGFAGTGSKAPMVMRILAPAGTPAIEASGMDLEAELLFKRGLRLRVVADHGISPDGVRHIDVEVMR